MSDDSDPPELRLMPVRGVKVLVNHDSEMILDYTRGGFAARELRGLAGSFCPTIGSRGAAGDVCQLPRPPPLQPSLVVPTRTRRRAWRRLGCGLWGNALLDAGDTASAQERDALAQGLDRLLAKAHVVTGVALRLLDLRSAQRTHCVVARCSCLQSLWPAYFYLAICYQSLGDGFAVLECERQLATADQPVQLQSRGRLICDFHAWKQEVRLHANNRIRTLSRPRAGRGA